MYRTEQNDHACTREQKITWQKRDICNAIKIFGSSSLYYRHSTRNDNAWRWKRRAG